MADYRNILAQQMDLALGVFGRDAQATTLNGSELPYTPPGYADVCYADWSSTYPAILESESRALDNPPTYSLMIQRVKSEQRLLTESELTNLQNLEFAALINQGYYDAGQVVWHLTAALNAAAWAKGQSTRANSAGVQCLGAEACKRFWETCDHAALQADASSTLVPIPSRWERFWAESMDGAESLSNWVGRAAAKTLEATGRGLGAGIGGFVGELGVVNLAIIFGAGYLLVRGI